MSSDIAPSCVLTKPVAGEDEYYALGEDSPFEYLDGRLVMSPSSLQQEDMCGFLNGAVASAVVSLLPGRPAAARS